MANFMDKLNAKFIELKIQINKIIQQINAWPQYRKIGAGIIVLGLILLLFGIILY